MKRKISEKDKELQRINEECAAECEPLRKQLLMIQARKDATRGEIALLKAKLKDLGMEYNNICIQISEVRARHAERKEYAELSAIKQKEEE